MIVNQSPRGSRPHIAVFGRRNTGKSTLLNAFLGQELSIVSSTPGTTTDPIEKAYELQPAGPVVMIDTAGIDDEGDLGVKRVQKTLDILKRTDIGILVIDRDCFGGFEEQLIQKFKKNNIPWILVSNKQDLVGETSDQKLFQTQLEKIYEIRMLFCSALRNRGIEQLKNELTQKLQQLRPAPPIAADLVQSPEVVVLVIPIDKEAPKGRLILPQVQTIRELLDADVPVICVKERELHYTLSHILKDKPKLVITDSQAFLKVDADVPEDVFMTSFSILFARQKGDLETYVSGVKRIESLKDNDLILISELCSHHPITEDIGRIKIPRWLKQYSGADLKFEVCAGKQYPEDLSRFQLIIQCGGCVSNRQLVLSRIREAKNQNTPITNYGIIIAYLHGILNRALKPFNTTDRRL